MTDLPPDLEGLLPQSTRDAWTAIAAHVPPDGYLAGGTALTTHLLHRVSRDLDFFISRSFDPEVLADVLERVGRFEPTQLAPGTLNGIFDDTKVQFLDASSQQMLDKTTQIAGIEVAGMRDLLATKLKVIADRGELRDYFDLLTIEQRTDLRVEAGLDMFVDRYRPRVPSQAVAAIVLGLGYLDDVADDPTLPMSRAEIERYWTSRQPEITWPHG